MRIMLVDDVASNLVFLREMVRQLGDCAILNFTDPVKALAHVRGSGADLVLVDYRMPGLNGVKFIQGVRAIPGCEDVPVVMVTTSDERDVRLAALQAGATDFLTKPIDTSETLARIRNMLKLRDSQNRLKDKAAWLEAAVQKATASIAAREEEIIMRLSRAAEYRDSGTGSHIMRMAQYCRLIAEALGLEDMVCHDLYLAAPMHDIGKIAVSDTILLKAGKLTDAERAEMQQHTMCGRNILADSDSDLIRMAADIALSHHERWDGGGYPHGLRGADIPLPARIAAVADVFDALTSERPYKAAWTPDEARIYISENSGHQFDPACVRAFLARWPDVLAVHSSPTAVVKNIMECSLA
jgi:response regulator RpfG family c-di-GMP phosphodiesterase